MSRTLAVKLAVGLFCGGSASAKFVPFANVEELKPQRIDQFCGAETFASADGKQLRHCEHHFKKQLDDGGDVELGWKMDVDPDTILSLDTEAEHGVRLTKCSPSELELELPESHSRHATDGQLVVGSRFIHGCEHLGDRHLYHRVTKVHAQQWGDASGKRVSRVRLATQELASIAHAIPSWTFHFSWMPVEAKDTKTAFPEMRTDYGLNRPYLERKRRERKLFGMPSLGALASVDGVNEDAGGFTSGGTEGASFDTQNGILNLMPKQLSNFGWNWNFFMNTTEEPDFELDVPGAKGILKIRKPFVKVHSGIYLNFSSAFALTDTPKVQWTFGIKGHGQVQGRMMGSLNTTEDAGTDPLFASKLPVLEELENPVYFEKVDFATGSMPISMEPGFQFSALMYHQGAFKGAVGIGGRTQGDLNPSLSYDSVKGFESRFHGNLTDTDIWPPLWMIFTKQFELGIMLKPTILMRGDFAGLERATMKIEGRPYMNISITREGNGTEAPVDATTPLTIYPMRVMGINTVDFNKRYKVKISANGQDVETSPQVNWGQVEFRDHVSNFACGELSEKALLNPALTNITVSLIEVDESGVQVVNTTLGTGQVTCSSLLNGECSPSPSNVVILSSSGSTVATVQLAMIWRTSAQTWFASKIRGLSFSFPQVILKQETLATALPDSADLTPGAAASGIALHLIQGGQDYVVGLAGTLGSTQSSLAGDSAINFAPGFVDQWMPCPLNTQDCTSPRLELYAGMTLIGSAALPQIEFTSKTAMQGTGGGFMSNSAAAGELNIPTTIVLTAPGDASATIAIVTMNAKEDMTLESSMFIEPRSAVQVPMSSKQEVSWIIADVDRSVAYNFTVQALALESAGDGSSSTYENYRQVSGEMLLPVGVKDSFSATCQPMTSTGLPASSAPCSFSTTFPFTGSGYTNGQVVILSVQWSNGGTKNQLFSPPFELGGSSAAVPAASASLGRRLLSEPLPAAAAAPRRLWTQEAWNARIQNHSQGCNKRNLKFKIGLGLKVRGKVDGLSIPASFTMLGGTSEGPALETPFRTIFEEHPGEELQQALGGSDGLACQAGLCGGALPGCSEGGDKKMNFPELIFDFNRPYHFANKTEGMSGAMKTALAYAFSTLPEAVDVLISKMNQPKSPAPAVVATPAPSVDWFTNQPSPAPAPSAAYPKQQVAAAAAPVPAPAEDSSLTAAFDKWWSGASTRRLSTPRHSSDVAGDADELPATLAAYQVRLRFKRGVHFIIDRPLVEVMLQNGYFKGLEDVDDGLVKTHGPLQITRFYVNSGLHESARFGSHTTTDALARRTTPFAAMVLAVVGTASLAAFVVLWLSSTKTTSKNGYSGEFDVGPEGLE